MELTLMEKLTELAAMRYLKRKEREGTLTQTLQRMDEITQDGLENLAIVKQAEADYLRQDLS